MILRKDCDLIIVVPENATERELFAASELRKYIKRICGAQLAISSDNNACNVQAIAIGGPERNVVTKRYVSEAEFDSIVPGLEGLFIKSYEDCLVLAGSSKKVNECERGTVYAVYEFLERFLGCSLTAYIKEGVSGGEYVPEQEAFEIKGIFYSNLELFCRIFGDGGRFVAENIRYAESILDGQCEIMTAGIYLMNHIDKERMYQGFEKALEAANTPAARNNIRLMRMAFRYSDPESREEYKNDEIDYKALKHYDIPERGELLYMQRNFDSYVSHGGYGIMIPVEGDDNGFNPDEWYMFE